MLSNLMFKLNKKNQPSHNVDLSRRSQKRGVKSASETNRSILMFKNTFS